MNRNIQDEMYTLRLEHREGGAVARCLGEERLLIFRSDQPGAIAKIVFSSSVAPCAERHIDLHQDEHAPFSLRCSCNQVEARIHVLHVKEAYRGFNLGSLLFREALSYLRNRYLTDEVIRDCDNFSDSQHRPCLIRCQLDAEEDQYRYNKLVRFYERLGCTVKANAKESYLNNNDGETYRKVPMQIILNRTQGLYYRMPGLKSFLPVSLCSLGGKRVVLHKKSPRGLTWLLVDDGQGYVQLRTTADNYLMVQSNGKCCLTRLNDNDPEDFFQLQTKFVLDRKYLNTGSFWLFKSYHHRTYLTVDSQTHYLCCTPFLSFWQARSRDLTLMWVGDVTREPVLIEAHSSGSESDSMEQHT